MKLGYQTNHELSREWKGVRTNGIDRYDPENVPLHIIHWYFHCRCGDELHFEMAGFNAAVKHAAEHKWTIHEDQCYCPSCFKRIDRLALIKRLQRERMYASMRSNEMERVTERKMQRNESVT